MAIEFAADRFDVRPLDELDGRLDNAYQVMVTAKRGAPDRQRTLEALIDSSYALFSPEVQLLWSRRRVFAGRFGMPAATAVCADEELSLSRNLRTDGRN